AAVVVAAAAGAWLALPDPSAFTYAAPSAEGRRLRRVLNEQLAAVGDEIARLRAAGDVASADALDAEFRTFRRRAAGAPRERSDEPELHVVSASDMILDGVTVNLTVTDRLVV